MTDQQLKTLRRQRGSVKTRLTHFEGFVVKLEAQQRAPQFLSFDQTSSIQLQDRLNSIQNVLQEFDSFNDQLIELVEDDVVESQFEERYAFENAYFTVTARAKALLEHCPASPITPITHGNIISNESPVMDNARNTQFNPVGEVHNVKLPTLNLVKFSGQYSEWLSFYDTFHSLIHNNDSLNSIQKFHYLRSCLESEALQAIQNLEISSQNYEEAWKILERRYKNKKLMIHNHIKGILDFQKINKESYAALRSLLDSFQNHTRALTVLGEPVDKWDSILIHIITDKFDYNTRKEWESVTVQNIDCPTVAELTRFLEQRCHLLEKIHKQTKGSENQTQKVEHVSQNKPRHVQNVSYLSTEKSQCTFCKENHPIFSCQTFLKLPISSRIKEVKQHKLCLNCLKPNHISINCTSGNCRKCSKKHNTLLHLETSTQNTEISNSKDEVKAETEQTSSLSHHAVSVKGTARVLPTALVKIFDHAGKSFDCIALIDSGSESNFITTNLIRRLGLKAITSDNIVRGISGIASKSSKCVSATIKSRHNDFKASLTFLVLPKITEKVPTIQLNLNSLHIPTDIQLADPLFYQQKDIDLLLGVDLFSNLLCTESQRSTHPYLIKTHFGHVFCGNVSQACASNGQSVCHISTLTADTDLSEQITKFWDVENIPSSNQYTSEEQACENHFKETTKRNELGQFIVTIPLKDSLDRLGESEEQARQRFLALERRLQLNPSMREMYKNFMTEYESLDHMSKDDGSNSLTHSYYMPHHGVLKPSSTTTKLRVVFNASAPSSTGVSLNNLQMVGPTIQEDLLSIIIRFRKHNIAITGDCKKMYRSVYIDESQRPLQRIFWRESPELPLQTYTLNTVTYGTASASFLAIRCLFELSFTIESAHPEISRIIRQDMYVDDLITGASSVQDAKNICSLVSETLESGGFQLSKWSSNEPQALSHLNPVDVSICSKTEFTSNDNITNVLGLSWNSTSDEFIFNIAPLSENNSLTKRTVLSFIAKLFDPMGILSPCIVRAKIFIQRLWSEKLSWDEPLPKHLHALWSNYIQEFPVLGTLSVPRQVTCKSPKCVELHGFCDASESAYGCCIYVRSIDASGCVTVRLLCSKSKVAPLKPMTIPKLELCGALLLTRLTVKVLKSLNITQIYDCTYWCDSSIVLAWIKSDPATLKIFVSNRVQEIISATNPINWRYVPSAENPADIVSRGANPSALKNNLLWWQGPKWLHDVPEQWPNTTFGHIDNVPEKRTTVSHVSVPDTPTFPFENYSDLTRLERVVVFKI